MFPVYWNPLGIVARDGVINFSREECRPVKSCLSNPILDDAVTLNMHLWDLTS